ncbi:MAG: superoxide dismutase [Vampirovibrionales bacterium]
MMMVGVSEEHTLLPSRRAFLKTMAGGVLGWGASMLPFTSMVYGATHQARKASVIPVTPKVLPEGKVTPLQAKPYLALMPELEGLSIAQWTHHLKLYEGYVKAWNVLSQDSVSQADVPLSITWHPERERHVEKSFALNGVLFHELYFDALTSKQQLLTQGRTTPGVLTKRYLEARYGSVERYLAQLMILAKTSRGWVMTAWVERTASVESFIMDTHAQGVPHGVVPLVVLDVYEHAYMIDFQTNRAAYLDVWVQAIRWDVVEARFTAWFERTAH